MLAFLLHHVGPQHSLVQGSSGGRKGREMGVELSADDWWCTIIPDVDAGEHDRVSAAGACNKMVNMPI